MLKRSRLLAVFLIFSMLLCAVYLLRWPLFGGMAARMVSEALREQIGAEVFIEGLSGPLFTGIRCQRVEARAVDERAQLRSFTLESLHVEFNPFRLLKDDLSAMIVTAGRGSVSFDGDRLGLPGKEDSGESPFALPTALPVLDLRALDVLVSGSGKKLHLRNTAFSLNAPDLQKTQVGLLEAGDMAITFFESTREWPLIRCPVSYSENQVRLGPLEAGGARNLLDMEISLSQEPRMTAAVRLESRVFSGDLRLTGRIDGADDLGFEADLMLHDIDLAAVPFDWFLPELLPHALQGRLSIEGKVQGCLEDAASLRAEARATVRRGAFDTLSPLDVTLTVEYEQKKISIPKGRVESGSSWLDLLACTIPIQEGEPRLGEAYGEFSFHLNRFTEGVALLGLEGKLVDQLNKSDLQGQGSFRETGIQLDPFLAVVEGGRLKAHGLTVTAHLDEIRVDIQEMEGEYEGKPFDLIDPAGLVFSSFGLESADLAMHAGGGTVNLQGRLSSDLRADIHTEIHDVDLDLIHGLLPQELAGRMQWDGLSLTLDVAGPVTDLTGKVDLRLRRFGFDSLKAKEVRISARRETMDRFDLDELRFTFEPGGDLRLTGGWDMDPFDPWSMPKRFDSVLDIADLDLSGFRGLDPALAAIEGSARIFLQMQGDPADPLGSLSVKADLSGLPPE
ncbi:MAG: hypothetical protein ABIK28_14120, partial [Planctomycetota bacterium]